MASSFTSKGGEVVYAGCASWSMVGKKEKGQDFDGVDERNLWSFHRLPPLMGVKITKVISGCSSATCIAIGAAGEVYSWGRNTMGQLGTGTYTNQYNPTLVDIPNRATVVGGACGPNHTLLFSATGSLFASGAGKCGQLGAGRKQDVKNFIDVPLNAVVVSVGCGRDFSMVVDSNGVIYSFGHPEHGCLGNGTEGKVLERANKFTFEYVTAPEPIVALAKSYGNVKIVEVSCGAKHTCAMDSEGRVYTWGYGAYGRLGHKDNKDQFEPLAVELFSFEPPPLKPDVPKFLQHQSPKIRGTLITCGNTCTYVVAGEPYNSLYMFGITKKSGEAKMYPTLVDQVTGWRVRSVSVGNTSTAVAAEKMLITWGPSPTFGELGYGEDGPKSSTVSKGVDTLKGCLISQLASGQCHTLAIVETDDEFANERLAALPEFNPDEVDPSVAKAKAAKETAARKVKRDKAKAKKKAAEAANEDEDEKDSEDDGEDDDENDEDAVVESEDDDDEEEGGGKKRKGGAAASKGSKKAKN